MSHSLHNPTVLRCGLLTALVVVVGLLLAFPAYSVGGVAGLEGLSYAAAICLVPGWVVIVLTDCYGVAKSQVGPVLLGMGLRFWAILGGVFLVLWARPHLGLEQFLVWIVVFYVLTLAFETGVAMRAARSTPPSSEDNSVENPAS